jgi:hypothetical protein
VNACVLHLIVVDMERDFRAVQIAHGGLHRGLIVAP